jgi:glycosyltransferase involved in cell wall biosynthesis
MVRALENWGWKTVVCTSKPESDHQGGGYDLMSLLPQSSEIIRSNTLPGKKITRLLRVLKLTKIAKLVSSLPDDGIFWYPTALCSLNKVLKSDRFNLIQTRSFPITNHLLGFYAKKKSGLPWLVHFSDPWVDSPFYPPTWRFLSRFHIRLEHKIIKAADRVTFTTEAACKLVMRKYPEAWMRKCHVIPHGFVSSSIKPLKKMLLESKHLNIVYLGSFYGKRNPYSLFKAIKIFAEKFNQNSNLRIWLIGKMPHQKYADILIDYGIRKIVKLRNSVPYRLAMAYAKQADVLLTIDSTCENPDVFLESKLIEYFGLKKPILGIVYPLNMSATLLRTAEGYVADIENPMNIAETLNVLVKKWQNGQLSLSYSKNKAIESYKIENTTKQLVSIFSTMK